MSGNLARYACDKCRSRKVSCSREQSGCQRCKTDGVDCSYSRSGVIRRSRKQNFRQLTPPQNHDLPGSELGDGQPKLASEVNKALERLQTIAPRDHSSLKPLASLMADYCVALQDTSVIDQITENVASKYFLFEDRMNELLNVFTAALERERLLLREAPPDVLTHLRSSQPDRIKDRAWLVMFYSIVLKQVSMTAPEDHATRSKLRSNLWLAFGDIRTLLEPTPSHCQALIIMASYVEDFSAPTLCWMLLSKACIMLQAIGVVDRRLDQDTSNRRKLLFWRLNVIDKTLALILRRPPTFHRAMSDDIGMPSLDCLFRSLPPSSTPALFDAHFIHQMYQLSQIMGNVWHCVFFQYSDHNAVTVVRQQLQSWHHKAKEVLQATAVAERPFHTAETTKSLDFNLIAADFQYYYLDCLLTRSCADLRSEGTLPSQYILHLLDDLEPGTTQHPLIPGWQLLHAPFTIFLTLFGEVMSSGRSNLERSERSIEAMGRVPTFLAKLTPQYPVAAKLERYASQVIRHTRSLLYQTDEPGSNPSAQGGTRSESADLGVSRTELLTPASTMDPTGIPGVDNMDAHLGFPLSWTDDGLLDAFDWFTSWDMPTV